MHLSAGYSLMGALGSLVSRGDPFWIVSYGLLMGSAVFKSAAPPPPCSISHSLRCSSFSFSHGTATRAMPSYTSEVSAIPWNNQALFFTFAFFFWLYTVRASTPLDMRAS